MTPLIVLFWIICAIAGGLIGLRTGHQVFGALIGLLLGPVGVLLVVLCQPKPRTSPAAPPHSHETASTPSSPDQGRQ